MQAFAWSPPTGALGRLCARAYARAEALDRDAVHAAVNEAERGPPVPSLLAAVGQGAEVAVIAELKRRSPSKGSIRDDMSATARAAAYASGGARALSILTEPQEFGGSLEDISAARASCSLPILKKDFHVLPIQVLEAKAVRASALLLIARALGPARLEEMMNAARGHGIETLVEVRREEELRWALDVGASMIGINCRDLETLEVELDVHPRLLPLVPSSCVAIAESGVASRLDVSRAALAGADAVLVGSSLSQSADATVAVSALTGVARVRRAG